jgi:hypothetical protein
MVRCDLCQHAKIQAIDADLSRGTPFHRLALKYHVAKNALVLHASHISAHMTAPVGAQDMHARQQAPIASVVAMMDAFAQFKQAWYAGKDDPVLLAKMLAFVQDQLADENMGL